MRRYNNVLKLIKMVVVFGVLTASFVGCSATSRSLGIDNSNNKEQDMAFVLGHYDRSARLAYMSKDLEAQLDTDNLLATLKAGNSFFYARNYSKSIEMLDEAESIIKYQREQALLGDSADYIAQLMLNDAATSYQASMTSAIMLNTYKALSYMSAHKFSQARIELNRAIDRQRRAKEEYAELINQQKEALEKEKEQGKSVDQQQARGVIDQHYSNLNSFKAYPDFVNPFTIYLAGLFFHLEGDNSKSIDLLKEASAMAPQNKVIATDFELVDAALSGKKSKEKYVWVLFENGLGPIRKEIKINIPLFLFSSKVSYTGIALPQVQTRTQAYPYLEIQSQDAKESTQIVGELDRVVMTEFKYTYNYMMTRAILSATLKTYAQYEAGRSGGGYAQLAMGLFQGLTTRADTRAWSTLPKDFQVSRIAMPENKQLWVGYGANGYNVEIDPSAQNAIVYVRIPTAMSLPSISVINF